MLGFGGQVCAARGDESQARQVTLGDTRVRGERRKERRRHGNVGDAVRRDQIHDRLELGDRDGDDRRAEAQRGAEHEREADRVEERRAGEHHGALVVGTAGAEGADRLLGGRGQVAVREAHALWQSAGAAGERDGREILGLQGGLCVGVAVRSEERFERCGTGGLAAHGCQNHVVEAGAVQCLAHLAREGSEGDGQPRRRAREHARRLIRRPQRAQRRDGGPRAPDAEGHHRPPREIGHGDGHQVARSYPALTQPRGEGGRARGQLAARQRLAGGAVDDREAPPDPRRRGAARRRRQTARWTAPAAGCDGWAR